jgi:hypothetical protein
LRTQHVCSRDAVSGYALDDVTLLRDRRTIHLHLRWKGGATTSLDRPIPRTAPEARKTPAAIIEMIRALTEEQTDKQIAATLNGRFLRSGTDHSFTRLSVRWIRTAYAIPSLAQRLRAAGWLTVEEMTKQLGVHHTTTKRFALEGVLEAQRVDDRGGLLFAPPTGPLSRAHPGKRFRDRRCHPQCASHKRKELQYEA